MKRYLFTLCMSFLFIGEVQAERVFLPAVEAYLSRIEKDLKQEWQEYEQEVVTMPQWQRDIQAQEVGGSD